LGALEKMRASPYLVSSIVTIATLLFAFDDYLLLRGYLNEESYCLSVREMGRYLWNLNAVKLRDLTVFACLTRSTISFLLRLPYHTLGKWLCLGLLPLVTPRSRGMSRGIEQDRNSLLPLIN